MFGEVIERKEAFLDYKKLDLKKSPNLHFCQGFSMVYGLTPLDRCKFRVLLYDVFTSSEQAFFSL